MARAGQRDEGRSYRLARQKCERIMERYPTLRAQPLLLKRLHPQTGQEQGRWHVRVVQARGPGRTRAADDAGNG